MARGRRTITIELEELLANFAPEVRNLALALRDLVFAVEPDAVEQIDVPAHLLAYGYAKTYKHLICVIILYKEYVNFGFPRGVDLPDPEALLHGTGKRARHIRIDDLGQVEAPEIAAMMQASVDLTPRPDD
ncbi:MAG: DUF1801 domain-containing protein [Anaerolineales bacterium]